MAQNKMTLVFDTNLSFGTTITLPLYGTVDVTVNWGDENEDAFTSSGRKSHTYEEEGEYTVNISGTLTEFGSDYNAYDNSGTFSGTDSMDKPKAWNIEAGYTMDVQGRETTFAIAYQGTDDLEGALPEERYMASVGVALAENVGLAVEYAHDEDYDDETDDDAKTVTIQLALEF